MSIRFVIRPASILSTPRRLKEALHAERTLRYPGPSRQKPSLQKDFFLTYPRIEELEEYAQNLSNSPQSVLVPTSSHTSGNNSRSSNMGLLGENTVSRSILDNYRTVYGFASVNKPEQRRILSEQGFPIPITALRKVSGTPGWYRGTELSAMGSSSPVHSEVSYIVRPLRHSQGRGWRLTSDPTDFHEGTEYIQEVYPKNYEYRVIAVRGKPLITLLKRNINNIPQDQPWNHANGSSFVTVQSQELNRLRRTNVYDLIEQSQLLKGIDLAGVDILYAGNGKYVVAEVNLCPSLQIETNLEEVARYVLSLS